jgi:phage baseplate assembly protein V
MIAEIVHKLTEDLRSKVRLMIGRAILAAVSDTGPIQTAQAQLMADEVQDDVERIQQYGFTSVPLDGAEAVVAFVGGNRDHGLIIAVDDRRYRLKGLQGGEVAIYDDQGQCVILQRNGRIYLKALTKLSIDAADTEMSGNLKVLGDINGQKNITALKDITATQNVIATLNIADQGGIKTMAAMRQAYNAHRGHTLPGSTPDQGM